MNPARDELIDALGAARNRQFAELLVLCVGIAAETHPEELRAALAQVFDLKAVEEQHRRMDAECQRAREYADDVRAIMQGVGRDLDRCAEQQDQILRWHAEVARRQKELSALIKRAAAVARGQQKPAANGSATPTPTRKG